MVKSYKIDFNECRERISIITVAEDLGYTRISGSQATNLTYVLGKAQNPEDEIVIFPQKNSYFSRRGTFNDKGDLTKFILNRLHMFPYSTQPGYTGVTEVLSKYLNGEITVKRISQTSSGQATKEFNKEFNLNYWNPQPIGKDNTYLLNRRKLSPKTVEAFNSKLFIYTVGKSNHIAFPFRKPGQMEIVNFEMRNFFPDGNVNYKAFCTGGDKAQSCWIANFVPFDKVTDIYLFESAIDAMSFYEIKHFTKESPCAFISTGGWVTQKQIESIKKVFPNAQVKWHCCFDNDGSGNGFDVTTAYYLNGEECKAFKRPTENGNMVYISFPTGESYSLKESEFSSVEFLKSRGKDNVIDIIKPPKYKDWNELLAYYKRFDADLGPGMKFIPAIEGTIAQLNLRGYHQLAEAIGNSENKLIESLLQQSNYCLSAPLAESKVYTLLVDCNIFMGIDTMIPVPNNLYIFDKSTQKTIPAYTMNEFLKKEYINLFRDLTSSDFQNLLEKQTLTFAKGNVEKNFDRVVSPTGWGLKNASTFKKKVLDIGLNI